VVLYGLFDDCCFWVIFFKSLIMEGVGCSIENLLFSIAKAVLIWVYFPIIVSFFLFTWRIISMSLFIHSVNFWIILNECTIHWVKHFFCAFKSTCWYTKGILLNIILSDHLWPFILSSVARTKRLSFMGGILIFFDIVKLVC